MCVWSCETMSISMCMLTPNGDVIVFWSTHIHHGSTVRTETTGGQREQVCQDMFETQVHPTWAISIQLFNFIFQDYFTHVQILCIWTLLCMFTILSASVQADTIPQLDTQITVINRLHVPFLLLGYTRTIENILDNVKQKEKNSYLKKKKRIIDRQWFIV